MDGVSVMKAREAKSTQTGRKLDLHETRSGLIHALRSFASALNSEEIERQPQELLALVLENADRLRLERVAVADACQVSEATVSRWRSGKVKPHSIIARVAIRAVANLALQKAHEYEQELCREGVA